MIVTGYDLAQRFVGLKEDDGPQANPLILAMLQLDSTWPTDDAVPWCSAFVNAMAWLLRLPRSKSLAARSWLTVGTPVSFDAAAVGFDVVVLARGVSATSGHVGFFAGLDDHGIHVLGGNQGNAVSVETFPLAAVLGIRRLSAQG